MPDIAKVDFRNYPALRVLLYRLKHENFFGFLVIFILLIYSGIDFEYYSKSCKNPDSLQGLDPLILEQIFEYLTQEEALALMKCCTKLNEIGRRRLYRLVEVNEKVFIQLGKKYGDLTNKGVIVNRYRIENTIINQRQFLKLVFGYKIPTGLVQRIHIQNFHFFYSSSFITLLQEKFTKATIKLSTNCNDKRLFKENANRCIHPFINCFIAERLTELEIEEEKLAQEDTKTPLLLVHLEKLVIRSKPDQTLNIWLSGWKVIFKVLKSLHIKGDVISMLGRMKDGDIENLQLDEFGCGFTENGHLRRFDPSFMSLIKWNHLKKLNLMCTEEYSWYTMQFSSFLETISFLSNELRSVSIECLKSGISTRRHGHKYGIFEDLLRVLSRKNVKLEVLELSIYGASFREYRMGISFHLANLREFAWIDPSESDDLLRRIDQTNEDEDLIRDLLRDGTKLEFVNINDINYIIDRKFNQEYIEIIPPAE